MTRNIRREPQEILGSNSMKGNFGRRTALAMMMAMAMYLAGCGGDDPIEPDLPEPTVLKVIVRSGVDSTFVENSNVVLYQAETREAVLRGMTNPDGTVYFQHEMGNYYVNISAQGFESVPPENITAIPFFVAAEDTTVHEISLNVLEGAGNTGYVLGFVEPAINNFLVLAESQTSRQKYSTVSGPDGVFVVYNLPYDTYSLDVLKSGHQMNEPVSASVSAEAPVDTVRVGVTEYMGSLLAGSVTFLASENSIVDITLLDPETRSVVPGLAVMNEASGLTYRMAGIPDGSYLAWASLKNDGYVIDPDWVFKNPGGLNVSFATLDTTQLNFSVTDAITLQSPTNPADSTIPAMADSVVPTFRWAAYPSAKEYFIEVRDLSGKLLWGGFESSGIPNHAFVGPDVTSVEYNFDSQSGVPALEPGKIYRWQVWADKGTQSNSFVEQLISASEDLRGMFRIPEDPGAE
jgi:hypothetical protein